MAFPVTLMMAFLCLRGSPLAKDTRWGLRYTGMDKKVQREYHFFDYFMMQELSFRRDDSWVMNIGIKCQTVSKNNPFSCKLTIERLPL